MFTILPFFFTKSNHLERKPLINKGYYVIYALFKNKMTCNIETDIPDSATLGMSAVAFVVIKILTDSVAFLLLRSHIYCKVTPCFIVYFIISQLFGSIRLN